MNTLPHTLHFPDGVSIDVAAADRLLGVGDQFIQDWEADQADVNDADKDPELLQRKAEWAAIRPLFEAAPALLSTCVAIGRAGDVRDDERRARLQEAISDAGAWALLDPRRKTPVPAWQTSSRLTPEQVAELLRSSNIRVAMLVEDPAAALHAAASPSQGRPTVTAPAAEVLTIAYVALGARQAIEAQEFGSLPADVSDHFSGEIGFIDAVTSEAWRLDAVAYAIEAKEGGLKGVFCYEVAEPFGEHFAKALIAQYMDGAPMADPDKIAERVFSDFIEPGDYPTLLSEGMQQASPAPVAALADSRGTAYRNPGQRLAWSREDSAAATAEGWDVFDNSERGLEIERIDAPENAAGESLPPSFESDVQAIGHVYAKAQEGSALHQKALLLTLAQMRGLVWPVAPAAPVHTQSAQPGYIGIRLEGGVVQSVFTDRPMDVVVIDYDTDGCDPGDVFDMPQEFGGTSECLVSEYPADVMPEECQRIRAALDARDAAEHEPEGMTP